MKGKLEYICIYFGIYGTLHWDLVLLIILSSLYEKLQQLSRYQNLEYIILIMKKKWKDFLKRLYLKIFDNLAVCYWN